MNYANAAQITNNSGKSINVNDYQKNTRERFVASLATKYNISYEKADVLEKKEATNSTGITIFSADEIVKYKTVDKQVAAFVSGTYYQSIYISTEVRYVWNRATNQLVNIENIGQQLTYLPGISLINLNITSGGYNIEKYLKTARISLQ